jgi:hypothetical protein
VRTVSNKRGNTSDATASGRQTPLGPAGGRRHQRGRVGPRRLPDDIGGMTREQLESGVREALASSLAPEQSA